MSWRDKPRLVDKKTGEEHVLLKDETLIGRHKGCDILVPVVEISRRHCRIYKDDGMYFVEDMHTVNGTYVNEKLISSPHLLRNGFHLKVAKCSKFPIGARNYIFRWEGKAGASGDAQDENLAVEPMEVAAPGEAAPAARTAAGQKRTAEEVLASLGEGSSQLLKSVEGGRIPIRHCIFRVVRRKQPPRRVPLLKFTEKQVVFFSLREIPENDQVILRIEHPNWSEPIEMMLKVGRSGQIKNRPIHQVECKVVSFAKGHKAEFAKRVETGPLLKYFS